MTLTLGSKLGSYEVLSLLGAGGMGEVYRARDTRLGRVVAIKVLPAERMADENRRRRFVQEARAASALNHPNIVTIHEIESVDGIDFIVMEYVPGKTLDTVIPRQGMRLSEVLRIAIPIADAVARAHAAGIVHRDLKPANVVVGSDGAVKVLDFGLAKLVTQEEVDSPKRETKTEDGDASPLSRPGTVAGTVEYMSPEQATGNRVDSRSDVFSFGAVLYEMVTGRRAFAGNSTAETLAAVLREQPKAPRELAPDLPPELERIILRCLRKERERRFQHMLDVKVELQEVKEESDSQAVAAGAVAATRLRSRRRWVAWAATGLLMLAVGAFALWRQRRPELPPSRLVRLTSSRQAASGTFSPDGSQVAYQSFGEGGENWDIWLSIVGEAEARRLTTDPAVEDWPAWSPDGKQIAFVRYGPQKGRIYVMSALGGGEHRLADFPTDTQLSWSVDGRWLAAGRVRAKSETTPESGGIHLIPIGVGTPRPLTFPKAPMRDSSPAFSPDGRALAYASCKSYPMDESSSPSWLRDRACDVFILTLDSDLRPHGEARRVTRERLWIEGLAWTREGRSIVFGAGIVGDYLWRVPADGGSPPEHVELAGPWALAPFTARNQDRLGFARYLYDPQIYRFELGGIRAPFIQSTLGDLFPQYSPDGRRIAFERRPAIWLVDADGSNPTQLTRGPGRRQGSPSWSPDGRTIAFDVRSDEGQWDIWTIGVDGSGLRQVTREPSNENVPSFSRDGRWIYFGSDRTGRNEVWRVGTAGGPEEQVTREGGDYPVESFDGRTLYYQRACCGSALLARPTAGGAERTLASCVNVKSFAIGPRGIFHVDCTPPDAPSPTQRVLRHWDVATGRDSAVGTFEAEETLGLCVSPDGRTILYDRSTFAVDLMMIENFR